MAHGDLLDQAPVKVGPATMSDAEWRQRVDLAALYRAVALYGWDDMIFTHISARVPGPDHYFLINPYGLWFGEMTASALVKVDPDGNVVQETEYTINPAGFTIHSAIHAARPEANVVIHLHTDAGVAVSAQRDGLLPLTQYALAILPRLAYHDYEGIALDLNERERLVADLGAASLMLLRNHGTLAVGQTPAGAWWNIFGLERACKQQVLALSAGREQVLIAPQQAQDTVRTQATGLERLGALAWPGLLRKLDRDLPGYDT